MMRDFHHDLAQWTVKLAEIEAEASDARRRGDGPEATRLDLDAREVRQHIERLRKLSS